MAKIYVGMSGWTFPPWRGEFYPKKLVQKKELSFASRCVNSIELNGTFYSLQKPQTFQKWYDETPDGFCFSVKAPQFITHIRRLKDVEEPLCNFMASGLLCLGEKLGPILWQFPPSATLKDDRFETFMKLLPHDAKEAAKLAKKHSSKMDGRAFLKPDGDFKVRHAFEFRHPSFKNAEFIELMRKYGVAVVFAHAGLKSPYMEDVTADFIYARMHGQDARYKKGYTKDALDWFVPRVEAWTSGHQPKDAECVSSQKPKAVKRDAFIYFDTDEKEYSPFDALNLSERLGLKKPKSPEDILKDLAEPFL